MKYNIGDIVTVKGCGEVWDMMGFSEPKQSALDMVGQNCEIVDIEELDGELYYSLYTPDQSEIWKFFETELEYPTERPELKKKKLKKGEDEENGSKEETTSGEDSVKSEGEPEGQPQEEGNAEATDDKPQEGDSDEQSEVELSSPMESPNGGNGGQGKPRFKILSYNISFASKLETDINKHINEGWELHEMHVCRNNLVQTLVKND